MSGPESSEFVFDYSDHSKNARIQSAKPLKPTKIHVYREGDKAKQKVLAVGTRSKDGKIFNVVVSGINDNGYEYSYQDLIHTIRAVGTER